MNGLVNVPRRATIRLPAPEAGRTMRDMKPRVYIETTIPSYLTAWPSRDVVRAAHQQLTRQWWQTRREDFDLVVSQLVLDECAAGDAEAGTTSLTLEESYGASPGYTAETSTLQLIQGFLYAISALVVGAFFTVLTIQRRQEIAVMRALGAGTGYLLRDSLVQSIVLLLISGALGVGIGVAAGAAISSTPMPFDLQAGPIALASTALLVLGVVGAAVAVVRIVRVDPLVALGDNR